MDLQHIRNLEARIQKLEAMVVLQQEYLLVAGMDLARLHNASTDTKEDKWFFVPNQNVLPFKCVPGVATDDENTSNVVPLQSKTEE